MTPTRSCQPSTFAALIYPLAQSALLVRPQLLGRWESRSPMPSLPAEAQLSIVRPHMGHAVDRVGYGRT
jgi:hypothetical protein